MADILVERQTHIMVGKKGGLPPLYPSDTLFPHNELYPRDAELEEVGNIVAGSMKLDEMMVDKEPVWGLFFSTKFEVKLFNIDEDLSGRYIHVYQVDRGVRRSVFTGYIDSCKKDKIGDDRTLIAYDPAYYWGSTDVSKWWETFWEANPNGATLHDIRMNLLGTFMFPHEDVELPNDNVVVSMNIHLASGAFANIIKMLCELSCSYPHFNRDGMLEFILFDTEAEPIDLTGRYEWNASDFEEYETSDITGVQFFDSGDQLKRTIGSANNAYGIYQNVFTYGMNTETLDAVGQVMFSYLRDFKFVPSKIKMIVGDFNLHVGDYVKSEFGNFYIFKSAYSGSQLIEQTISAQGSMKLNSKAQPVDWKSIVTTENIARVTQNVEEFKIEYYNTVEQIGSIIQQNYDSLVLKVDSQTTSAYIITRINQNGDDQKIVSAVEIGADVIDINGIVRLLEAEEIRTVLNGDTGEGEPSKFIKYTGNNIEFFEGSYDDNDLKAALSYDGLDYYRNQNFIGRYTTNPFREFSVTNLAVTKTVSGGGITITKNGTNGININGTSDETVSVDLAFLNTFTVTQGRKYRLMFKATNLPYNAALQLFFFNGTNTVLIANCNNDNAGLYYTFTAPISGAFQLYLRKGKQSVTYENSYLTFEVYDITEENQRQYGLDIELRDGAFWQMSNYNQNGDNETKLLYAKDTIYSDKAHNTKLYDADNFYVLAPLTFKQPVHLNNVLCTNGQQIRYQDNYGPYISVSSDSIYMYKDTSRIQMESSGRVAIYALDSEVFDASTNGSLYLGYGNNTRTLYLGGGSLSDLYVGGSRGYTGNIISATKDTMYNVVRNLSFERDEVITSNTEFYWSNGVAQITRFWYDMAVMTWSFDSGSLTFVTDISGRSADRGIVV